MKLAAILAIVCGLYLVITAFAYSWAMTPFVMWGSLFGGLTLLFFGGCPFAEDA